MHEGPTINSSLSIQLGAVHLSCGHVIAYPCEAVWGLGCDPFDACAVAKILTLKRRNPGMGLILVAANIVQLSPYLEGLSSGHYQQLEDSWPGPITWLLPDNGFAPAYISGDYNTVALRVSKHPVIQSLCQAYGGPIVSTSANPHGLVPAQSPLKLHCYFGSQIDFIVSGSVGKSSNPTEIKELTTGIVKRSA